MRQEDNQLNPYWIVVDDGDTFCGHQGHWADCFFSNATIREIQFGLTQGELAGCAHEIRRMTDSEVERWPEALEFREFLISKYGEE